MAATRVLTGIRHAGESTEPAASDDADSDCGNDDLDGGADVEFVAEPGQVSIDRGLGAAQLLGNLVSWRVGRQQV